jgi:hypothetical protein
MKESVTLETEQWNQLMNILTSVNMAWATTNPLIMSIGGQLQVKRAEGLVPNGPMVVMDQNGQPAN